MSVILLLQSARQSSGVPRLVSCCVLHASSPSTAKLLVIFSLPPPVLLGRSLEQQLCIPRLVFLHPISAPLGCTVKSYSEYPAWHVLLNNRFTAVPSFSPSSPIASLVAATLDYYCRLPILLSLPQCFPLFRVACDSLSLLLASLFIQHLPATPVSDLVTACNANQCIVS